jgi:IS30 family transposase
MAVHKSSIRRELKRNSRKIHRIYSAKKADDISCDRRIYASRKSNKKMTKNISCPSNFGLYGTFYALLVKNI